VIAILRFLFDIVLAIVAPRATLDAEKLLLRQQLIVVRRQVKRPRWHRFDRCLPAALAGRFYCWLDAVLLVKPETVIRWHRAAWRLRWRSRRPPGRPSIDPDLRELIRQMWRENPTWGQKIISAEDRSGCRTSWPAVPGVGDEPCLCRASPQAARKRARTADLRLVEKRSA
jgi:hypothetical protein